MAVPLLSDAEIRQIFEVLAENLPVGVTVQDKEFRLQYINQRHAALNKLDLADQLGKPVREFLPHVADIIEPKLQFVFDSGQALLKQQIRAARPNKDGKYLFRLASYFPIKDEQGQTGKVMGLIQDASIDNFEQQLHEESQQRLLRVLDNLSVFIWLLELDGTLINTNRAPLEAAGITVDDVAYRKIWDCYWWLNDEDSREQIRQMTQQCRQGDIVRSDIPIRMGHAQRCWVDFMIAPMRNEQGQITHLIASGIDITKRHDSEVALHRSEDRWRSVVESSADAIITQSPDGIVTGWNPAAERLLGYSGQEATGRPVRDFFPPERFSEEEEILERIRNGERITAFETERVHQSGRIVHVSVTISPLRNRSGQVIGACRLERDISRQKEQREMLERALEEKTALLHEVHHRVKNNLQIVSSLLNLQARKAPGGVAEALAESQGRIKAMALVHQLLYESSNMSEIGLADFLRNLMNLSVSIYGMHHKGIQLKLDACPESVVLDVQRMIPCGLVINELILNAVKHAFPQRSEGLIRISAEQQDDTIRITVADNGCGLPDGFRWDQQRGLGSQLIPMFVHQLHGDLSSRSGPGGAVFTITLTI